MTAAIDRAEAVDAAHRLADVLRPVAAQALEDPNGYPFAVKAALPGVVVSPTR